MIEPKKLKEVTYSSDYVAELERKIEDLEEENALIKHRYFISECKIHHLETYKAALNLAISNAIIIGGCDFWENVALRYGFQQFYNKCIHRNVLNIPKGITEFYLSLVANAEVKKNGYTEIKDLENELEKIESFEETEKYI